MAKVRSHQVDVYGAWLHAVTTPRGWAKLAKDVDSLPEIEEGALGFTSRDVDDDGGVHLSVYVDAKRLVDNPAALTEVLAHEAAHAAGMLLDHIGQEYDGESEAFAYLIGFIAAWLYEATVGV